VPTGVVTFLLTDIAASTPAWEADNEQMAARVARHYELIDGTVERFGGFRPQEQGEGDSTVSAFVHPSDAVGAAIEIQRTLDGEFGTDLRVRMALHSGDAQLRDASNYFGPAIIRSARLRACAHGGQVLVSRATADLVADRLPDGASLLERGVLQLKGLPRPERVFELSHAAIRGAGTFPPLRSAGRPRHRPPSRFTPLVGREDDLRHLDGLVTANRVVTLTGTGGCGKTRLAAECADRRADDHEGGVWWCELASRRGPDAVAVSLAALLEVEEEPGPGLVAAVGSVLAGLGSTLVVLDNAEHVLDEAAAVVAALVEVAPDAVFLVTSREPLSVPGEVAWRVPSLSVPSDSGVTDAASLELLMASESVRLFVELAGRARPGFCLTEENAAAVVAICRRLDGIPLALELAAARVRTLPPAVIASQLDDRFRLLTGGARTLLPRQQTLEASVAWSEDLLDPPVRAAWRRVSVFVGGFSLEGAEQVLGAFGDTDADEVLDLVATLVDKSLLTLAEDGRYVMLETVRAFGLHRLLEAAEADVARDAHAAWAARFAREAEARFALGERRELVDAFDSEWPNLVAALEWLHDRPDELLELVAHLGRYWVLSVRLPDAITHGLGAIERFADDPPPGWARAVGSAGGALGNARALVDDHVHRARDLAAAAGDVDTVLDLDGRLANMRLGNDLSAGALQAAADVAERAAAAGNQLVELNARLVSWQFLVAVGRMAEVEVEPPRWSVFPLRATTVSALAAMRTGDLRRAHTLLESTAELFGPPPERLLAQSIDAQLRCLSGGQLGGVVPVVATHRRLDLVGVYRSAHRLLEFREAVLGEAWATIADMVGDAPDRGGLGMGFDAVAAAALMAGGHTERAATLARDLVERGTAVHAPLPVIEGSLVLAELELDADRALVALTAAVANRLVLARIDALEMLAICAHRAGRADHAAVLKATCDADRAQRQYRFRWPTRAALLAAIEVPDTSVALDLERATELALRGTAGADDP
jgi:predicted ATPase/class 3 adenylate cyclase